MAQLAPEVVFTIGNLPITNTIINTALVDSFIVGFAVAAGRNLQRIPRAFQNFVEFLIETGQNFTESIAGENTKLVFPFFASFFLFIVIANWSGLIPGVGSIGIWEGEGAHRELIPFLRNATSDFNVTLGLALISFFATHILAIRKLGLKGYASHFFNFKPLYLSPIFLFVGVLEVISEFTKLLSLSFRLFGNIYAGEVVLSTTFSIFAFIFPVPFLLLEVLIGGIQALIFSTLTIAFMSILMTPHHE